MCGRYTLYSEKKDQKIKKFVEEVNRKQNIQIKTGDIYPSDLAPIIRSGQTGSILELMQWGYDTPVKKGLIINARSETVMEKKMFLEDFKIRRCLIPSGGFYEWDQNKNRYLFNSDDLFYFAGVYKKINGINKYVILTKAANKTVSEVHDRMPVIIPINMEDNWLHDIKSAVQLMKEDSITLIKQTFKKNKSDIQIKFPFI